MLKGKEIERKTLSRNMEVGVKTVTVGERYGLDSEHSKDKLGKCSPRAE